MKNFKGICRCNRCRKCCSSSSFGTNAKKHGVLCGEQQQTDTFSLWYWHCVGVQTYKLHSLSIEQHQWLQRARLRNALQNPRTRQSNLCCFARFFEVFIKILHWIYRKQIYELVTWKLNIIKMSIGFSWRKSKNQKYEYKSLNKDYII